MSEQSPGHWAGVSHPDGMPLRGSYVDLEPLSTTRHVGDLFVFAAPDAEGREARFRYLFDQPPRDLAEFRQWTERASASADSQFYAVVDRETGRAEGRQALMHFDDQNGVIEIGHILWGPRLARTRGATEAFFLLADFVFSRGYRRLEWKCDNHNIPSKRAAERFGFTPEGVFKQHMVVKGLNRDTAWFSILDGEWDDHRRRITRWLDPANFDADGVQRVPLVRIR